jgi:uncharacterized RDD family membrane protein YckC
MEAVQSETIEVQPQKVPKIARIGDRVMALILDTVALLPIYFLVGCVLGVWFGSYSEGTFELPWGPTFLYLFVLTVIWIVYYAVSEASYKGTVGKYIVGIEIGSAGPLQFSAEQAFRRNLLRPVDAIGFYLLGFLVALSSKQRQTIGDRVAGTIVCEKERVNRRQAVWVWIAFFVGGVILNAVFRHYAVPVNQ